MNVRDAKEYLIRTILAQSDRDGVALSDVERKMLYFSESGWTLPNMRAISREFDQTYDQGEYEKKIAQVIRRVHSQPTGSHNKWDDAVQLLRGEDHYLIVLIDGASDSSAKLSRWELAGVVLGSMAVVAVLLPFCFFVYSHVDDPFLQKLVVVTTLLALVVLVAFVGSRANRSRPRQASR